MSHTSTVPPPVADSTTVMPHDIALPQYQSAYAKIVQISDLHLFEHPSQVSGSLDHDTNFRRVLALIEQELDSIDLLLVTGDLVNEISEENYQQIFARLDRLGVPYCCIAGNHDVTQELDPELPFEQRRHVPMPDYPRLVNRVKVSLPYWDILLVNSSVAGQIYGNFDEKTLSWLQSQLAVMTKPCIIMAHHPMVAVNAQWLDENQLKNADEFWQTVMPYTEHLKAIFVGHIHQENHVLYQGVHLFSTPSTCMQFTPFHNDFAIDTQKTAGFRWITLYNNANLATGIKRIDTM